MRADGSGTQAHAEVRAQLQRLADQVAEQQAEIDELRADSLRIAELRIELEDYLLEAKTRARVQPSAEA